MENFNRYKFRAWNNHKKEMFYFNIPQIMTSDVTDAILVAIKMGAVDIMQYTGLKDKNGKDIYEDDILERYSGAFLIRSIVKWGEYRWDGIDDYSASAIVGNVYENQELIKG